MHMRALRRLSGCALVVLLALLPVMSASAQARAWLDRDRIALGETATLNIETSQGGIDAPDYSPLLGDFALSGNTSSRSVEIVNGASRSRSLFAVALEPKREGVIGIPGLLVGGQRTQPLTLTVTPPAATPARAGGPIFIEAETDAQEPYVQQAVGYTVRLYYAVPLLSGHFDQPAPDGATLQQVGDDVQYTREISGRRYTVLERHYLLIPERSGTLAIPGARFQGRGAAGFFDDLFGDGRRDLSANGAPRFLEVRPAPANAPQPWLPLRGLTLRYVATPQSARAGEAVDIVIEAKADGATAAQMPELQLPSVDGAQVFADPAQTDESFRDGRPQVRVTRRFSLVPAQPGALHVPGPKLRWWDARAGSPRTASLPDLDLQVAPGANTGGPAPAAGTASADAADAGARGWMRVPGVQGEVRPWAFATVVFALLWLVTLMWGLHRDPQREPAVDALHAPGLPGAGMAQLRRALDNGDFDDIATVLCAMAVPPVGDVDTLLPRLPDPRQRDAVVALQQARWGGGDGVAARAALRAAFRQGPRWRTDDTPAAEPLPPLYP